MTRKIVAGRKTPWPQQLLDIDEGGVLLFYFDKWICPGHVNVKPSNSTRLIHSSRDLKDSRRDGPAICINYKRFSSSDEYQQLVAEKTPKSTDHLLSIHCDKWPEVARLWITRWRLSCWPDASTVKAIVSKAFNLVHVAHPDCGRNVDQWRFSFFVAEIFFYNVG